MTPMENCCKRFEHFRVPLNVMRPGKVPALSINGLRLYLAVCLQNSQSARPDVLIADFVITHSSGLASTDIPAAQAELIAAGMVDCSPRGVRSLYRIL